MTCSTNYTHVNLLANLPPPLLDEIDAHHTNGDIVTRSTRVFEAMCKWIWTNTNWDIQFDNGRVSAWEPRVDKVWLATFSLGDKK